MLPCPAGIKAAIGAVLEAVGSGGLMRRLQRQADLRVRQARSTCNNFLISVSVWMLTCS